MKYLNSARIIFDIHIIENNITIVLKRIIIYGKHATNRLKSMNVIIILTFNAFVIRLKKDIGSNTLMVIRKQRFINSSNCINHFE